MKTKTNTQRVRELVSKNRRTDRAKVVSMIKARLKVTKANAQVYYTKAVQFFEESGCRRWPDALKA